MTFSAPPPSDGWIVQLQAVTGPRCAATGCPSANANVPSAIEYKLPRYYTSYCIVLYCMVRKTVFFVSLCASCKIEPTTTKKIATKGGWGQTHFRRSELYFWNTDNCELPCHCPRRRRSNRNNSGTGTTKNAHHSAAHTPGTEQKESPAEFPRNSTRYGALSPHLVAATYPVSHRLSWFSAGYKRRSMENILRKRETKLPLLEQVKRIKPTKLCR